MPGRSCHSTCPAFPRRPQRKRSSRRSAHEGTAARAYCPVVTVRPPPANAYVVAHRPEILLGINAHAPDEAALGFAFESAQRHGSQLRVVHAWQPPEALGAEDAQAEDERALLDEALALSRKQY